MSPESNKTNIFLIRFKLFRFYYYFLLFYQKQQVFINFINLTSKTLAFKFKTYKFYSNVQTQKQSPLVWLRLSSINQPDLSSKGKLQPFEPFLVKNRISWAYSQNGEEKAKRGGYTQEYKNTPWLYNIEWCI